MTNADSVQANSRVNLTVFKMACLTLPATTFFVSQIKKKLPVLNSHNKTFPGKKIGNKDKATIHKNKRLSDYIYSIAKFIMQSLFDVYKNWII